MDIPLGDVLKVVGDLLDALGGLSPELIDTILNAICSQSNEYGNFIEIPLGITPLASQHKCAGAAQKIATSNGYDYTAVKALKDKIGFYPQVLVFGRLRRVLYAYAGILIISILLSDHYSRKIKQIDNIIFNTHVEACLEKKDLVSKEKYDELLAQVNNANVINNQPMETVYTAPMETPVNAPTETITTPVVPITDLNYQEPKTVFSTKDVLMTEVPETNQTKIE